MTPELCTRVWRTLLNQGDVVGLGLSVVNGRLDLRGIEVPVPAILQTQSVAGTLVQTMGNTVVVRGAHWRGLNFGGAQLSSLRFFDSVIEDCLFDDAMCRDWRLWGTRVIASSFRNANLRDAALGGLEGLKRNTFERVDFTKTDLRGSAHRSADFRHCVFERSNLRKVNFRGNVFEDCRFTGELRETAFARQDLQDEGTSLPCNKMLRVDLRDSTLRWVIFRGLDLETTSLPRDEHHIIVNHAPRVFGAVIAHYAQSGSETGRSIAAVFEAMQRHLADGTCTVIHRKDLVEIGGEEAVGTFLEIMQREVAAASQSSS